MSKEKQDFKITCETEVVRQDISVDGSISVKKLPGKVALDGDIVSIVIINEDGNKIGAAVQTSDMIQVIDEYRKVKNNK